MADVVVEFEYVVFVVKREQGDACICRERVVGREPSFGKAIFVGCDYLALR